ncbi:hypothetical protein KSS87_004543 [Heliosperma pusillum]|nr:hypothetical protein KSS87_004543 [Heliosperma pusillum]
MPNLRSPYFSIFLLFFYLLNPRFLFSSLANSQIDQFYDVDDDESSSVSLFHHDYSPSSTVSCEGDLGGVGTLDTTCQIVSDFNLTDNVKLDCSEKSGCEIAINVTGNFSLGENFTIIAGAFELYAWKASLSVGSVINTTGLGGDPPAQTSKEVDYGGGWVKIEVLGFLLVNGSVLADGGDGGDKGGGGSGGNKGGHIIAHKMEKSYGTILDIGNIQNLEERRYLFFPFSLILHNTKPDGHQDLVGLVISIILLGDFSLVLLTLLQLYSASMAYVFLVLFILPLGILLPFPAGINALFSHGPQRSVGLARLYALWNINSVFNVVVALICGYVHFKSQSSRSKKLPYLQPWGM